MFDFDVRLICRDENCTRPGIHRKHAVEAVKPPTVHHRPKQRAKCTACGWRGHNSFDLVVCPHCKGDTITLIAERPPWEKDDPTGLTGAVARATSKLYPMTLAEINREVQNDYGSCTERTVYRHLARLVKRGHIVKLDLQLGRAVYLRPKSRLLNDLTAVREIVLDKMEVS